MTSSPGFTTAAMAQNRASVAPDVTVISVFGSGSAPYKSFTLTAIASRNGSIPIIGGYWLYPCVR